MIKSFLTLLLTFYSVALFASSNCPQAVETNNPNFCASFKSVAQCHCTESGLPQNLCKDVTAIYNRMLAVFGSVQHACEYQHDTTKQTCMDDWSCYNHGGKDSRGNLCSNTSKSCL